MQLQNISLNNFKNYESFSLNFGENINCLLGENGSGKTNLLDAIHYLSMTKSAFNANDRQSVQHQSDYFTIEGEFALKDENYKVFCGLRKGDKKILRLNGKVYDKLTEHVGRFPVVLIAPSDTALILEGSETRRRFFDSIISQLDRPYLEALVLYKQALKQRNALLKTFAEKHYFDADLLATYSEVMLEKGAVIAQRRQRFMTEFSPYFQAHYATLSQERESPKVHYRSEFVKENYREVFHQSLEKDRILQRSNVGIHKDDYRFALDAHSAKYYGSQGQQKSLIVALKLAQFDIIADYLGVKPLLLLDDIFDKLDDRRMQQLIMMVAQHKFGQIFVTDARPERSRKVFEELQVPVNFFEIANGVLAQQFNQDMD